MGVTIGFDFALRQKTLWVSSSDPPPYFQPPEPLETMVESSGSIHVGPICKAPLGMTQQWQWNIPYQWKFEWENHLQMGIVSARHV